MLLGRAPEAVTGNSVWEWIHPDDQVAARAEFDAVLNHRASGLEASARFLHADGSGATWRRSPTTASPTTRSPAWS